MQQELFQDKPTNLGLPINTLKTTTDILKHHM